MFVLTIGWHEIFTMKNPLKWGNISRCTQTHTRCTTRRVMCLRVCLQARNRSHSVSFRATSSLLLSSKVFVSETLSSLLLFCVTANDHHFPAQLRLRRTLFTKIKRQLLQRHTVCSWLSNFYSDVTTFAQQVLLAQFLRDDVVHRKLAVIRCDASVKFRRNPHARRTRLDRVDGGASCTCTSPCHQVVVPLQLMCSWVE